MFSHIPNLLTLARIAICPILVVLLYQQQYRDAFYLFIVAGITDALDGYIAKKYNFTSRLGAILDPLADKLLIASTYIMLTIYGHMPFWVLTTVIFRDLVILTGYFVASQIRDSVAISPLIISKLNTVLQITFMVLILAQLAFGFEIIIVYNVLMYSMVITTILSGIQYVWLWGFSPERIENESHSSGS